MATPDGISSADWDLVHELAVNIVNADEEESEEQRARLLSYLDKLREKYGELPSILATRANYIDDVREKERLWLRAYALAEARSDGRNMLYIAHSLAELYIEEFKDKMEGRKWLERLRQHVIHVDDSWFAEEYERLREAVEQLGPAGA